MARFKKSTLFISYDGLLDPLGRSQILPYIQGIAAHPRPVHILSFEKPSRLSLREPEIREHLEIQLIAWTPLKFTDKFGLIGKLWDLTKMYFFGIFLAFRHRITIVHARGHPAAQVGLVLAWLYGCKLLFDFRGLWVDERLDKGSWDLKISFHRLQYYYCKKIEEMSLRRSDQVVVLTRAVVDEVIRLGCVPTNKITVIPCCADFDHFPLKTPDNCNSARKKLGIPEEAFVLGYLGSVGRMYMMDRFLRLVELSSMYDTALYALVITPDVSKFEKELRYHLPQKLYSQVKIKSVERDGVAELLPAIDLLISFIKPSYARIAASPTKIAEALAVGIPTICNYGVGDIAMIISELDAGAVVNVESDKELDSVAQGLNRFASKGGSRLREKARGALSMNIAAERYRKVYTKLDLIC